jgi:vitamin B12/bleomycin/antimicrobial peptide transport system ATP-binding/permease protein
MPIISDSTKRERAPRATHMPLVLKRIFRLLRLCVRGPGGRYGLVLLAVVFAMSLVEIEITLRLIAWMAAFYGALERVDAGAALHQLGVFGLLIGINAAVYLVKTYIKQALRMRWRRALTGAALDTWLADKAYWHVPPNAASGGIDNPDQRIADDCRIFVEHMLGDGHAWGGVLQFIVSLIALVTYVTVLWNLSSFPLAFTLFGLAIEIPRYMVWAAPVYVLVASGLTHVLGAPLHRLYFEQQRREADFRYGLVRVREAAGPIALSDGEPAERRQLDARFAGIVRNWRGVIGREFLLGCFTRPYQSTVLRIPLFLALPAYLAGHVKLGGLMQLGSAFQNVVTTLSWFVFNYRRLTELSATSARLANFMEIATAAPAAKTDLVRVVSGARTFRLRDVTLKTPDGRTLLALPQLVFEAGQNVWLQGESGLGKSTLIKAMAGLWKHGSGRIEVPRERVLYLPQQAYVPLGAFAEAAAYPRNPAEIPPGRLEGLIEAAGLSHRAAGDEAAEDVKGLSVGEQQRLALLRLLIAEPAWAFLDEATSALDLASERRLLALLRERLPRCTFILVAHREPHGLGSLRRIDLGALPASPSLAAVPVAATLHGT